ncbi:MAG: PAS domain S-box protein [Rhodobacteraceae bacterium]|nr:PAS domain S-box protein [Paracoccaceae bacterium]MCY4249739.1 PAS domain S-box protein [Paracoccaceae bacterium]
MTAPNFAMLQAILDNLSDGVLVIDFDSSIRMANPAFCQMFALANDDVVGRNFGELFVLSEDFDAFSEAVLDAVTKHGDVDKRVVQIRSEEKLVSLTFTASLLMEAGERTAVIVTLSDITEIRELRDTQLLQAEVIGDQLGQLRDAYRDLESRNEALQTMTQRVRAVRGVAITFVAVLFLGIGAWYLRPLDLFNAVVAPNPSVPIELAAQRPTFIVSPRDLSSTINLRGNLSPGRAAEIVSPIESHVSTVYVSPGDLVMAGDRLLDLETGNLAAELRQAEVDNIQATERLTELENWENSADVARSRRALRQAKVALDDAELQLSRNQFLLDRGLIPSSQFEEAERNRESRRLEVEEAERELKLVESKGTGDPLRIARLQAQSSDERLQTAQANLELAQVSTPINGIVISAPRSQAGPLARGRPVSQGELLLTVADMEQLSVVTSVDEVDLHKVKAGQDAWISGPGFANIQVDGHVERVSSRALSGAHRGGPQFEIVILLDKLEGPALEKLRVGMSAFVTIVIHDQKDALLVPLSAVQQRNGKAWLYILPEGETEAELREVETGLTTLDSVEVLKGLAAGETVLLSP